MSCLRLHLTLAFIPFADCVSMDDVSVRREGKSVQRRTVVVGSPGEVTVDDVMSDAESPIEYTFVRREGKRKSLTEEGSDDTPVVVAQSPLSAAVRRSGQQRSSSNVVEIDEDMMAPQHQSNATQLGSPISAPSRLIAKDNCLKLNKDGFPLDVHEMLRQFPTKHEYFDHITSLGYDKNLHVEAKGRPRMYENTCLQTSHVIFIGDCMERQSFNAYVRNRRAGQQADGHLIFFDEPEKTYLHKVGEGLPIWTEHDASYVRWFGGDDDAFVQSARRVLQHHNLNTTQDSVLIWMGIGIHPFFREAVSSTWTDAKYRDAYMAWAKIPEREAKLHSFVSRVRKEFPGARLMWGTTGLMDLELMQASPSYPNFGAFPVVAPKILEINGLDERVMKSLGVPVVPRADISTAYRGLQCDGLHSDPHDSTGASAWNCPGYIALEELVLQAGLAELCGGSAFDTICAPS